VTTSVAAPGDTNPSDATGLRSVFCKVIGVVFFIFLHVLCCVIFKNKV